MKFAIVDDNPEEIRKLSEILQDYADINRLDLHLETFGKATDLLEIYSPYSFAGIFMDIYMEEMNGIEASRRIRQIDKTVFLIIMTTSDEHRAEAFGVHAYDYIEKPLQRERIFTVMDDIMQFHTLTEAVPMLTFLSNRKEVRIPYSDIVLIRTGGHNFLEITDVKGDVYHTRLTFHTVSDLLSTDPGFIVINRGVIAGIGHIVDIRGGTCLISSGNGDITLPVNLRKEEDIIQTWRHYKFMQIRNGIGGKRKK